MKQKILSFFVFAMAMLISITANAKVEKFVTATPQKVQTEKFLPLKMTQLVKGQSLKTKTAIPNARQARESKVKSQKVTKVSNKMTRRTGTGANTGTSSTIAKRRAKAATAITIGDFSASTAYEGEYYVIMTDATSTTQYIFDIATESFELGKTYTMSDMIADYTGIGDKDDWYAWEVITDATYTETKDEKGLTHVVASMTDTEGNVYDIIYDQPEPHDIDVTAVDWSYDAGEYDVYVYSENTTYLFELKEDLVYGKTYTYADMNPTWTCTLTGAGYPDIPATDATLTVTKDEVGLVHIVATMVLSGNTHKITFDEKPFAPSGVKFNVDGTNLKGQYLSSYGFYLYTAKWGDYTVQLAFDATEEKSTYTNDDFLSNYGLIYSDATQIQLLKLASDITVTNTETTKTLTGSIYAKNGDEYVLNLVYEKPAPKEMNINVANANLTDRTTAGYWMIDGQTADKNNAISLYFIGKEFEGTFTDVNSFDSDYTYVSDKSSGSNVYYDSPSAINITSAIVGDSLCIDGTMTVTSSAGAIANVTMHISTPYQQQSQSDWTEWEDFAPAGSNDAVWDLAAWAKEKSAVKCFVRTSTADATKKQIKVAGYGAGILTVEGVDILINWNTTTNDVRIPIQLTGYFNSSMKEDVVFGDVASIMGEQFASSYPSTYDPEQGKFSFNVLYSVPSVITTGSGFGLGVETLQMAGQFKDYSLSFSRGNVDDEATPIKQTVNVNIGKDVTSYRVHVDTYENYAAAKGSAAYFEALAKAEGTDYTDPSVTVDLQGSEYNIYVVVVSAFVNGEMNKYDYDLYEVSPASDWETVGTRPYREDIVTSLYNFGITGPVYNVEVQKHKKFNDIYRIKNPYGSTSPFGNYTLYENAYLYLNAQDPTKVSPTFQLSKCDLGVDVEGGAPMDLWLADDEVGGTFDGYAVAFPKKAIVSNNYYVNTNGLFRAVINFRDPVIALADNATSVLVNETAKISTDNKFNTPTFESLTPEIATVDAKGVVTGIAPGMAKIKVVQDSILEFNAVDTVLEITIEKNDFVYGEFIFNTDEGLAALGIEKPESGAATNLTNETLTSDVVSMALTDGTNPTRVWNSSGATDLRMYKSGGSFTFSVPEGYSIINIDFTGTECSLFGKDGELEPCTKTHSVWTAPEGETVTSKDFAAIGTCKISVIKVKVATPEEPAGALWDFTKLTPAKADGTGNLKNEIKDDGGAGWSNLQNNAAITDAELTIAEGVPYEVTKGLKFTAGGSGWLHIRNYPEDYFGMQLYSNNKDLMMTVPAQAGQYVILTALSPNQGVLAVKAIEGTDTTIINVCANAPYVYQSKNGDVKFNIVKQTTIKKIEVVDELPVGLWDFNTITASVADGTGNLKNNIVDDGGASWSNHQNNAAITDAELTIADGVPYNVTKGLKFTAGGSGWLHIRNYPDDYNGKQLFSNNKDLKVTVPATTGQYVIFDALSASGNTQIVCGEDTAEVYPGAVGGYIFEVKVDNPQFNIRKQLTIKKITVADKAPVALKANLKAGVESNVLKVGDVAPITWSSNNAVAPLFTSDNEGVATVDAKGNITGVSAGEATITVTQPANAYFLEGVATINVTVENAGPTDLGLAIAEAVAGKVMGDTAVVTLDGKVAYTFEQPVDAGLVNIIVNGNGAVVTLSDSVQIAGQQGIEINNVNFDCAANTKLAPIALSANPDSVLVGANYPVAEGATNSLRSKAFYNEGAIVINGCNFSGIHTSWISANKREWNLKTLKIVNTIAQFDVATGIDSYINWTGNSNNEGSIKDIVIEGSTLYNIVENNDNRFLRLQNNSNSQAQKAWAEPQFDAKESWTMTNNTFVNMPSNKEFANNYPNKNNVTLDFKGNIFYNTWRLQKISTSAVRNFTAADNAICGVTNPVDATDAANYATEDTLLCKGEKPFVVPTAALDLTNPDLKANFTPYGLSYAAQNSFGDPRWAAEVVAPALAIATDSIEVEGVKVKRPATWKFGSNEVYQLAWTSLNPATPAFASSDEAVATVDAEGKITPVAPGYATITLSQEPTAEFKAASTEFVVMVCAPVEYADCYADEGLNYTALNMCDILTTYSINGSNKYGMNAPMSAILSYFNPGAPIEIQTSNRAAFINPITDAADQSYVPTSSDGSIAVAPVVGTQKTLSIRIAKADSIKFYYTGSGGSSTTVTMWVLNEAGDTIATVEGGDAVGKGKASNTVSYEFPDNGKYTVVLGGTAGDMEIYYGKIFCQPEQPTGINEINNFPAVSAEGIFNLRGQKVTTMRPGNVYIVNGKKYIAK